MVMVLSKKQNPPAGRWRAGFPLAGIWVAAVPRYPLKRTRKSCVAM
jgi:hypothetical protein